MRNTENKVSYTAVVKMIIVVLVFVIQIYILTNQFKEKASGKFSMI